MFGVLARIGSRVARPAFSAIRKTTGAVLSAPGVRNAVKALPYGAAVLSTGAALIPQGGSGMPMLPGGGGLPALPGTAGSSPIVGDRGIFQNDPNIVKALQPFAISKANLRQYYRSPLKGFVIRYDSAGDPYAIPKTLARKYLGWKPSKKPPISVGDHQALKRADRTVKKMRSIYSMIARVDKNTTKGGKVKVKK